MTRTAIIAGRGALPRLLAEALDDPFLAEMEGFPADFRPDGSGIKPFRFRIERLVPFLDHLVDEGITRVVFAGAVARPELDPEAFDARTAQMVPRLLAAMQSGDDAALREVIAIFEEWDLAVTGPETLLPDLVPCAGILTGTPDDTDRRDAARAAEIVRAVGTVDVGQGAVVAGGLCLAVETLPGTDAMLAWVRETRAGAGGLLYKAPKPGQDRRIDLPAIGPDTVRNAAAAGLGGIAWEAGGVMLLDRSEAMAEANRLGLFLWAHEP